MKTEWWYDDATFYYSGQTDVRLARLTIHADGTAEVLVPDGRLSFADADAANVWLVDEEFGPLDNLLETLAESGTQADPRVKVPSATCEADLLTQMVIELH